MAYAYVLLHPTLKPYTKSPSPTTTRYIPTVYARVSPHIPTSQVQLWNVTVKLNILGVD